MQNTYQKGIDTLARSLASPGKIIFSSSLQLTPAFLRPGKQKNKNQNAVSLPTAFTGCHGSGSSRQQERESQSPGLRRSRSRAGAMETSAALW